MVKKAKKPKYWSNSNIFQTDGNINERRHQLHEVIRLSGLNLVINDLDIDQIK